jgi:hypothetical protein
MPMTREKHDRAMDAISGELATVGDRLIDKGYSFDLIWMSMLMMVFQALVYRKGRDAGRQDARQLVENYFGGLSDEEVAARAIQNVALSHPVCLLLLSHNNAMRRQIRP